MPVMNPTLYYILIASLATSFISFVGVLIINQSVKKRLLDYLFSFAAGVMLSTAFLDLLPETLEMENKRSTFVFVLVGIVIFFLLEKVIRLLHHHDNRKPIIKPTVSLVMIGDTFHNFFDGLAIAAGFLVNPSLGLVVTIAIIAHEIPHEIADFSIFIYGGLSRMRALFYNFLSALSAVLGGLLGYFFINFFEKINYIIIAMTAGVFIYIACVDLIPEVQKEKGKYISWIQSITFLIGIVIMYVFQTYLGH